MKGMYITGMEYCTMNLNCKCHIYNKMYKYSTNFNLIKYEYMIKNHNNPKTYIQIMVNNVIIGKIFIKLIAPKSLKKMCHPAMKTYKVSIYILKSIYIQNKIMVI